MRLLLPVAQVQVVSASQMSGGSVQCNALNYGLFDGVQCLGIRKMRLFVIRDTINGV
jgi:hypothetical protein